jgi:hypothetical protein
MAGGERLRGRVVLQSDAGLDGDSSTKAGTGGVHTVRDASAAPGGVRFRRAVPPPPLWSFLFSQMAMKDRLCRESYRRTRPQGSGRGAIHYQIQGAGEEMF